MTPLVMNLHLLDELREKLCDNSEGSASHSKVIALFLLSNALVMYPGLQVDLHSLRGETMSQYN
ncbi:hypothetical protein EYF80_019939 [Liparis tanakae]|uniref:Uncharacterized protein n=1 Tax=Liparis tanakae TaxID=230148 RepID=A0A4Z2HWA6_9TELE|nr:hypothetical protein EYF80_019939 [Liparis tanakae]